MTPHSFRAQLGRYFVEHPRRWIARAWIAERGGEGGYRQRISELRAQGMTIECLRDPVADGITRTWYRYLPAKKG